MHREWRLRYNTSLYIVSGSFIEHRGIFGCGDEFKYVFVFIWFLHSLNQAHRCPLACKHGY